ncbi:MAG: translation initiation factor IF-2, partial [Candidatus Sumerlaeia bacterium]
MRVYELAKQINMSNKELLERFRSLGFEVKSHSSSVDDGAIRALYDSLDEDKGSSQDKGGAAKKPAAKAKSESAESKPEKAPEKKPKMDARAIALQKIQEAKLKRQRAHREALEAEKQKPAAPEEPATEASSEDLKPQEIDLSGAPHVKTGEKPVAEQSPKPKPEAAPAQPKVEAKKPAQAPQPAKPPQAPRQERKPEPKPQQQRRNKPIPDLRNRTVELEQLPSLPKRTPPRHERQQRDKDKPLDLTVPPSIEVMKMKPSRKPTKRQKEEDERNRKKGLKTSKQQGEKKIRPGRFLNIDSIEETVGAKEGKRAVRPRSKVLSGVKELKEEAVAPKPQMPKAIKIYGDITLGELAEKLNIQATDLIAKAMELGEMLNINKLVSTDLIELLASEFEVEIEVVPENDETDVEKYLVTDEKEEELKSRPPVVTIMGHVDHGKTTLLDTIRKTNVAEGEFGGITQHIGAYHVETDRGEIVFLDTPGHEAFTAMRARGASVTDIVILIVAADDSLMPQTIEAINHSRAAKVPIIVAINKVDLPAANVQKVRNDLMQHSLISEDLGGDTIICEVSAKRGDGIDHLLEMVLLQAEVMELKANPKGLAQGIVIESEIDPQRGTSATILIKRGTLKQGAPFVCGDVSGRVRLMRDDLNKEVEEATPSHPVEILGLDGCPQVGEMFIELESEREA